MNATLTPPQRLALKALEQRQYFKLICGGSFTESQKVQELVALYSQVGIDCVDIAPDLAVLQGVEAAFRQLPAAIDRPLVMVSLPLDPDPHFRKIELLEPACILCNQCVPLCPTEAFVEGPTAETAFPLAIDQPLCYGCGRCVAICPTEALVLHPFLMEESLQKVLTHPLVEAVELHTRYADPYMLQDFLSRFQAQLTGKLISVCFRPDQIPVAQWLTFLQELQAVTPWPLILQADGQPMSGSDAPDACLPALAAAKFLYENAGGHYPYITLSGGINRQTADYLKQENYRFIAGVGMGTVARRQVWADLENPAQGLLKARALVQGFKETLSLSLNGFG